MRQECTRPASETCAQVNSPIPVASGFIGQRRFRWRPTQPDRELPRGKDGDPPASRNPRRAASALDAELLSSAPQTGARPFRACAGSAFAPRARRDRGGGRARACRSTHPTTFRSATPDSRTQTGRPSAQTAAIGTVIAPRRSCRGPGSSPGTNRDTVRPFSASSNSRRSASGTWSNRGAFCRVNTRAWDRRSAPTASDPGAHGGCAVRRRQPSSARAT